MLTTTVKTVPDREIVIAIRIPFSPYLVHTVPMSKQTVLRAMQTVNTENIGMTNVVKAMGWKSPS
jgi:hypothetical protein